MWFGPKAAAAQLVSQLAEVNPLLGDRRWFTSAANLAKARAVALARLTPEERSAKARAAALARYSKSQKARGKYRECLKYPRRRIGDILFPGV